MGGMRGGEGKGEGGIMGVIRMVSGDIMREGGREE